MTYTKKLFFLSTMIICVCFNKEAHCQNKEVDFNNLIKTIKSGVLLNPAYDKASDGDSYYQQSNSYVADQIALEENKDLMRQHAKAIKNNKPDPIKKYFNHLESSTTSIADHEAKSNFNTQIANSYNVEENKALIRQTFRIYNKYFAQLNSIGFIQPNYHEPQIIPEGFWKAMWSTATSYLTIIWQ